MMMNCPYILPASCQVPRGHFKHTPRPQLGCVALCFCACSTTYYLPSLQAAKLGYDLPLDAATLQQLKLPPSLVSGMSMSDYAAISGFASNLGGGLGGFQLSGMNNLADMQGLGASGLQSLGFVGGLGQLQANSPLSPTDNTVSSPRLSKQRLFVVVHKGVAEDTIARLFRKLPGMEYCDLKKDRVTGKSKGFAYVNYSTQESAHAAVEQMNGMEFPPHTGHRIKVSSTMLCCSYYSLQRKASLPMIQAEFGEQNVPAHVPVRAFLYGVVNQPTERPPFAVCCPRSVLPSVLSTVCPPLYPPFAVCCPHL